MTTCLAARARARVTGMASVCTNCTCGRLELDIEAPAVGN